jgi:hypothetical protein
VLIVQKETATVIFDAAVEDYLNIDEFQLMPLLTAISKKGSLDVNLGHTQAIRKSYIVYIQYAVT